MTGSPKWPDWAMPGRDFNIDGEVWPNSPLALYLDGQQAMKLRLSDALYRMNLKSREDELHGHPWNFDMAAQELMDSGVLDEMPIVAKQLTVQMLGGNQTVWVPLETVKHMQEYSDARLIAYGWDPKEIREDI